MKTKHKHFSKFFAFLLAMLLVVGMLPMTVSAEPELPTVQNVHIEGTVAKWAPVEGADAYTIALMRQSDDSFAASGPVYGKDNTSYDAASELAFFGDGVYYFTVQAFKIVSEDNWQAISVETKSSNTLDYHVVTFGITVVHGTATPTTAKAGEKVTITAEAAPEGKEFDKWEVVSGTVTLADDTAETTTFTMPGEAVEVTATYKDKTVTPPHSHDFGTEWKSDADNHWKECSCGEKSEQAAHSFKWVIDKEATADKDGSKHEECTVCDYKKDAVKVVDTIAITGVVEPKYGETTKFSFAIPSEAGYKDYENACRWVEFENKPDTFLDVAAWDVYAYVNKKVSAYSGSGESFTYKDSYYYVFVLPVALKEGYIWADSVSVTVNGKTGQFLESAGPLADAVICTFGPLEKPADPEPVTYHLIEGDGQTVTKGTTAKFVSDAPFDKLIKVQVDGADVEASNYTAVSGSTDVTFNTDYINCLSEGTHTIAIISNDGQATGSFTVKAASVTPPHSHDFGTEWKSDADNHWKECSCGEKSEQAAHNFKWVIDKEAEKDKNGSKHEECTVCGYKKDAVKIPATGKDKPTNPTKHSNPKKSGDNTKPADNQHKVPNTSVTTQSPKTGDTGNIALWCVLMLVSFAGIALCVFGRHKFFTK